MNYRWKVTLWRVGHNPYSAIGKTRMSAFNAAKALAPGFFIDGNPNAEDAPDRNSIRDKLTDCFNRAYRGIGFSKSCPKCSVTDEWKQATVEIERVGGDAITPSKRRRKVSMRRYGQQKKAEYWAKKFASIRPEWKPLVAPNPLPGFWDWVITVEVDGRRMPLGKGPVRPASPTEAQ